MFKPPFTFRAIFPGIYGLIVIASLIVLFENARSDAFCALLAVVVTLPWSLLFILLLNYIASPQIFDSMVPGIIIVCVAGTINGYLLYLIGYAIDRVRIEHEDKQAEPSAAANAYRRR